MPLTRQMTRSLFAAAQLCLSLCRHCQPYFRGDHRSRGTSSRHWDVDQAGNHTWSKLKTYRPGHLATYNMCYISLVRGTIKHKCSANQQKLKVDNNVDKSNDFEEPSGGSQGGNKACWHAGADLALFVQKVAASFPR